MEKRLIFDLIKYELFNVELPTGVIDKANVEVLSRLYKLSKIHDLAHIISNALYKNNLLENGSKAYVAFMKEQQLAVLRYEQINYELNSVCDILEREKIPFIPLKGSILRVYYKEPWHRTSCDIDVLVKETDIDLACEIFAKKYGYEQTYKTEHDVSFTTTGGVHLELHYNLIEGYKTEPVLKTVWDNVKLVSGKSYHYVLTDEMFYFYHVAHMAKHFEEGGCGIRTFLDLYIMEENMPVDKDKLDKLLVGGGIKDFYNASKRLAYAWFGNGEFDDLCTNMEEYILHSGVYGNVTNRVAVAQGRKGGKIRYVLSRIFLPYSKLKNLYPVLEKHKILTPFCEIHRWFTIIFGGRAKRAVNEIKTSNNMGEEKVNSALKLMQDLGLN